ncbi:DUF1761 family protein [Candidatus Kaiserbacteria bacterium]|nr:DUF1761 family protein [Candidatus Kaiserbacteria bacterium]
METFLTQIEWIPVIISTIIAFVLGWVWYSPVLFVEKWQTGLPMPPKWKAPMWMPMTAQLGATLLLAVIFNLSHQDGHLGHAVLVVFTIMGFVKANGMYSGKTKMSLSIEVLYILAMALVMYAVNLIV